MKIMQAEYKTDIALLAKQLAERDSRLLQWMVGIAVAGVAVMGLLLRFLAGSP